VQIAGAKGLIANFRIRLSCDGADPTPMPNDLNTRAVRTFPDNGLYLKRIAASVQ
jgi:hypothetical protein